MSDPEPEEPLVTETPTPRDRPDKLTALVDDLEDDTSDPNDLQETA